MGVEVTDEADECFAKGDAKGDDECGGDDGEKDYLHGVKGWNEKRDFSNYREASLFWLDMNII